ncbi:MAG: 16S rRNA (uracil(1498)-N(3))-methyltransferase [Planctomycetes bacterium]|nr:16S rRNA (uracil(1498)-N(3))-methyltransferase [Planctomycetota bacterium]
MRRIRLYVPTLTPGQVVLDGEEHTHLARVLRLKPGARVELFDGAGRSSLGELTRVERRQSEVLASEILVEPEPTWLLSALVATPKGKRARRLVEALTELGVDEITPLVTARGEERPPRGSELTRWTIEASKQSGRNRLPRIGSPTSLQDLLTRLEAGGAMGLLPDTTSAPCLRDVLPEAPQSLVFVIGPEGGFTPEEREQLAPALNPVSLGPSILRIETAAQALVGGVRALWPSSQCT